MKEVSVANHIHGLKSQGLLGMMKVTEFSM